MANKGRIYWGREDQPYDEWLRTKSGQHHPAYRGQAYVVFERIHCGQIQANSKSRPSLPSMEFSCVRLVSPTVPDGLRLPATIGATRYRGVNWVSALYDVLTHPRGGLRLVDALDDDDWVAKATALEDGTKPAGGVSAEYTYISPLHTGGSEAEQIVGQYLAYVDGWLHTVAGRLRTDWFANDGTVPDELPEISHHDLTDVLELETETLAEAPTTIVVSCLDGFHDGVDLTEAAETAAVPFVRELTGGEIRVEKLERPWFTSRDTAAGYAARYAATKTVPGQEGRFSMLPSKAVRLDGTPLQPGDMIRLNWSPLSLLLVARITETRERDGAVEIRWQRERGITPLPYTPAADPRETYVLPTPSTPGDDDWAIAEAPPGLADGAVVALVRRVQETLIGAVIHVDDDGDWEAGATEIGQQGFAAWSTLTAAVAAGDDTIEITGTGIDLSPTLGSGATGPEQEDDTLIAVIGSEWLSIGAVTSVDTDTYQLEVLRGRFDTTAAAHDTGVACWVLRRADLVVVSHSIFASLAQRWFKCQLFHALETGAMSDAKTVTFRDLSVQPLTGLAVSSGTAQLLLTTSGTIIVRALVTWEASTDSRVLDGGHIRLEWRRSTESEWSALVLPPDAVSYHLAPLAEGDSIDVRVRQVSAGEVVSDWATVEGHEVVGKTEAPNPPTSLTATGQVESVYLEWTNPSDADLDYVEIWESADATLANATKIAEVFASAFLRAGLSAEYTGYWWVRAVDTSGNVSSYLGPRSATTSADATAALATTIAALLATSNDSAAAIVHEEEARADADTALAEQIDTLSATVGGNTAAITAEATARANADSALASDIDTLETSVATNAAAITSEATARANADSAIASDLSTLETSVAGNAAAIASETTARSDADSALASDLSTLQTTVAGNTAAITSEATARANADTALASDISTLETTVANNTAAISSEATTRANADSALASDIETLETTVGSNTAAIATEATSRASDVSALASTLANLLAQMGDVQAVVQILSDAFVDTTGTAVSRWALNLSADGVITSIEAIAQGGDDPVSVIKFQADLQSADFSAGSAGWRVKGDGDAEFNSVTIRNGNVINSLDVPALDPAGQIFTTSITITPTVDDGITLRYTRDGRPVTTASQEWPTSSGEYTTLTLYTNTILRVRAYDANGAQSDEVTEIYTNSSGLPKVSTPVISGPSGLPGTCTIYCATSGSTIYYSLNEGALTEYTAGFAVGIGAEVTAYAVKDGLLDSSTTYWLNESND